MDKIEKVLKKFSEKERAWIKAILRQLQAGEVSGLHITKLKIREGVFRIRKGDIRIIYRKDSDNKIFILVRKDNGLFHSSESGKEYNLEKELLHPLLKGSKHIRKYRSEASEKFVIFPYKIIDNKC